MGGIGSGHRYRWDSKATVEGPTSLDANRWMREGIFVAGVWRMGSWVWSDAQTGEALSTIGYDSRTEEDGSGSVRLRYTFSESGEAVDYAIRLQTTRPHLGGLRWWFTCPLVVGGRPCRRRVAKLYLRGKYFGCRRCQDLTYRSCQESHRQRRLLVTLARMEAKWGGFDRMDVGRLSAGELIALLRASDGFA